MVCGVLLVGQWETPHGYDGVVEPWMVVDRDKGAGSGAELGAAPTTTAVSAPAALPSSGAASMSLNSSVPGSSVGSKGSTGVGSATAGGSSVVSGASAVAPAAATKTAAAAAAPDATVTVEDYVLGRNGWARVIDDDGYVFFFHAETETTQWHQPADF
jgi:hypothetical protein